MRELGTAVQTEPEPDRMHVAVAAAEPQPSVDSPDRRLRRAAAALQKHPRVGDAVFAAAVFALSVGQHARHGGNAAGYLLSAGLTLPLVWLRRAPTVVFAVIAAVALAQWFADVQLVGDVALFLALYVVASTQPRQVSLRAVAVMAVGVALFSLRLAPSGDGVVPSMIFLSGLSLAPYFIGTTVQNRRAYLASLVDRAEQLERERERELQLAATSERTRLAREMHDIVAHSLTVIVGLADGAALANAHKPQEATEAMDLVAHTGRQALQEMRRLLGVLRDGSDRTTDWAPPPGLSRLEELVNEMRAAGLPASLTTRGRPRALSPTADGALYRVVQESLTNALKHGHAIRKVTVEISWQDDELTLRISDDGRPHPPSADHHTGHGLIGLRERIAIFGGLVSAGPTSTGWRVLASVPLAAVLAAPAK